MKVICYVDDPLIMAEDQKKLSKLKNGLKRELPANDTGLATDFLDMKRIHESNSVALVQRKYVHDLVRKLSLNSYKPEIVPCDISLDLRTPCPEEADEMFPYRSVIGSLLYIATYTKPVLKR